MPQAEPADLTAVAQDYLKIIWTASEWSSAPVTTKMLAGRLGVGAPTVSEMVRRLGSQGLVEHAPYGAIELTHEGRVLAVAMVRRHRLLETLLVRELGYAWDEVHDEAEVLEHAVSELLIERIDIRLGRPDRDPHGDPIPSAEGQVPTPRAVPLRDVDPGTWVVARVSDGDPEVLRFCAATGLHLDSLLTVVRGRSADGSVVVLVGDRELTLDDRAASALWAVRA